jgi:uncharacterized membrane protein YgcG
VEVLCVNHTSSMMLTKLHLLGNYILYFTLYFVYLYLDSTGTSLLQSLDCKLRVCISIHTAHICHRIVVSTRAVSGMHSANAVHVALFFTHPLDHFLLTLNSSGVVTGGTEDASTMKISTKPLSSKLAPVRSPSSLSSATKRDSFSTSAGSSGSGALKRQSSKDSVTGGDSSSGGAQQPDAKRTKRDSTDSTSSSSTTVIAPKPTLKVKHIIMHSVLAQLTHLLAKLRTVTLHVQPGCCCTAIDSHSAT